MSEELCINTKRKGDFVDLTNHYQSVILTTKDGKRHVFTGKAVFDHTQGGDALTVSNIEVTEAKPLPVGCYMEEINTVKEDS